MNSKAFDNPDSSREGGASSRHVDGLLPSFLNGSLDRFNAERVRIHLANCPACQSELKTWEAIQHASQASVAVLPSPSAEFMNRVWLEIERDDARRRLMLVPRAEVPPTSLIERVKTMLQPERQSNRRAFLRPLSVAAAGAAIVAAVALTPIGSYAQGFLTIFTPQQITAVSVTQDQMRSLPDLNSYGTFTQTSRIQPRSVSDAAAASTAAGIKVLVPGSLPGGVPNSPSYEVMGGQSASFTFSAAKALATAEQKGKSLPPMPANIDGSTIQVTTGSAVLTIYGGNHSNIRSADPTVIANMKIKEQAKAAAEKSGGAGSLLGKSTGNGASSVSSEDMQNLPSLVIGQTTAPVVTSTGATAAELEAYLLAQPGIDPNLASTIRAIGDPSTTLPIPIPVGKASSHPIQVQGVNGLSVADSTGIGGGIIWQKGGMVYGVAGTLSESDLIAIANSLQ